MTAIRIEHASKSYDSTVVVDDVSLHIGDGELFFLLGPSGCGKTTLLRSIAGFVTLDSGRIAFDDRLMSDVPPKDRGTGMVFQNYALWPHMTVTQNIAFGLDVRKTPAAERDRRVAEAVALVRLQGLERNRPTQLSGGQQQRVALARALVIRPDVLLLDEPLSNLDARLRGEMREEVRRIHHETQLTTIYVTHDQKEALSLADRMAVMHRGRVVQVGTPRELYTRPASPFVASFLGDANMIDGRVTQSSGEQVTVETDIGTLAGIATAQNLAAGEPVICCIRPESIVLGPLSTPLANRLRAKIEREVFLGELWHVYLRSGPRTLASYLLHAHPTESRTDREIDCAIAREDVVVLKPS